MAQRRTRLVWFAPGDDPTPAPGWVVVWVRVERRRYRTMGYRLRTGERSTKYRAGQLVGRDYAQRYRHKVKRSRRLAAVLWRVREEREEKRPPDRRVWEVTIAYPSQRKRGRIEDITIRVDAPAGATGGDIARAVWRAYRSGTDSLTEFAFQGIDWRGYGYPDARTSLDEALQNMGGILKEESMSMWGQPQSMIRIAPVAL